MAWVKVPIDKGYRPDYLYHDAPAGALRQCKNLLPYDNFYAPMKATQNYSILTGLVEYGDASNQLSDWVLTGVTTPWTDAGKLYWGLSLSAPVTKIVELAKDSAGATIVASGSRTSDGSVTLSEINNSGISGSVTLAYSAPDTFAAANYLAGMIGLGVAFQGVEFKDSTGTYRTFVGSDDYLWRMNADKTLTNVTRSSGGAYTATTTNWNFVQYSDWVIATNYADVPQIMKGMSSANFTALGGTPPKAKYILYYMGHLIFANLNENGTIYNNKLMWSGLEAVESTDYNNPTNLATGADYQNLANSGEVTGLATVGTGFMVFHPDTITYAHYTGAPYTFSFVEKRFQNAGAITGTPISIGDKVYFFDRHDIYVSDGNSIQSIGEGIKETICPNIKVGYEYRITNYHDPNKHLIYWNIPTNGSSDGTPDKMLVYNYLKDRFTLIDLSVHCIFPIHSGAYDVEIDDITDTMPDIPYTDSTEFDATTPLMACVTTNGYVATFEGSPLAGTIETYGSTDGNVNMLRRVRTNIRSAVDAPTAQFGSWFQEDDDPTFTTSATQGASGYIDSRATGRYLNAKIGTEAHGGIPMAFDADIVKVGQR